MTVAFARKVELLGGSNERRVEGYRPRVAGINALEKELGGPSNDAVRARSVEFKTQLAAGRPVDDMTVRRNEQDQHNLAAGVRARLNSASLAVRPPAKGSLG